MRSKRQTDMRSIDRNAEKEQMRSRFINCAVALRVAGTLCSASSVGFAQGVALEFGAVVYAPILPKVSGARVRRNRCGATVRNRWPGRRRDVRTTGRYP